MQVVGILELVKRFGGATDPTGDEAGEDEASEPPRPVVRIVGFGLLGLVTLMIASALLRKNYDLALANVSGAITQNAVMVMPVVLILLGLFGVTGVIPRLPSGAIPPIDLETTSAVSVFALTIYFLAQDG